TVTLQIAPPPPAAPAEGEAAEAEAAAPAPAPRTVVLRLGTAADNTGNSYVQRDGEGLVYTISGFVAERMHPETSLFQGADPAAAQAADMEAAGGQQIPPEILQ